MNSPKILIAISVFLLLTSAVFGVLNGTRVKTLRNDAVTAVSQRDAAEHQRQTSEKNLKTREANVATQTAKIGQNESRVASAEAELITDFAFLATRRLERESRRPGSSRR